MSPFKGNAFSEGVLLACSPQQFLAAIAGSIIGVDRVNGSAHFCGNYDADLGSPPLEVGSSDANPYQLCRPSAFYIAA
jgi:hypothetical protein